MTNRVMRLFLISVFYVATSWAEAPDAATQSILRPKDKAESHRFTDLKLKGQLKKPDMSYIYKRKGLRSEKIVNMPEDFNDEIVQDAGKF